MKKIMIITATSLMLVLTAYADDVHHPEKNVEAAATKAPAHPDHEAVKMMQNNMKKMQAQLERIGKAKSDEERQKLLADHMLTMRENMMAAKGMMGDDMRCSTMMGKSGMSMHGGIMSGQDDEAPKHEAIMMRLEQMEKRMDMMQMMMEQMNKSPSMPMPAR